MRTLRYRPAGFFKRAIAFFVDYMPIQLALYVLSSMLFGVTPLDVESLDPEVRVDAFWSRLGVGIGAWTIYTIYCIVGEISPWRGTFGKKVMGIRVITDTGKRLSAGKVILRNLMKLLSAIPCYLGFFAALVTKGNRAWHDILSGAAVVDSR